jgi:hypothetical protein
MNKIYYYRTLEFCICIFVFLTLPLVNAFLLIPSGVYTYLYHLLWLSMALLVFFRISKIRRISKVYLMPLLLTLFLALVILYSYFSGNNFASNTLINIESFRSFYSSSYRAFFLEFRYILISLSFFNYAFFIERLKEKRMDFNSKQSETVKSLLTSFILLNSLIIPVIYVLFGYYDPFSQSLFPTQMVFNESLANSEYGKAYSNYLAYADNILFSSSLLFLFSPGIRSFFVFLFNCLIILLIGSRATFIAAMLCLFLCAYFLFYKKISLLVIIMNKSRASISFKKKHLITLTAILLVSIGVFGIGFNRLELSNLISQVSNSRVYQTLALTHLSEDRSLSERNEFFDCFFESISAEPEYFILGNSEDECAASVHSTLSVLARHGLVGFLPLMLIVFSTLRFLTLNIKTSQYEFSIVVTFLILGVMFRTGYECLMVALNAAYISRIVRAHCGTETGLVVHRAFVKKTLLLHK